MNLRYIVLLCALPFTIAKADNTFADGAPVKDTRSRLDQIVRYYVTSKQFTGSVLVTRNGNVLLDSGYGYANREWQTPNTPDTRFLLASITKQFTAASILLLEERGKLKTDDPVTKYLPEMPSAWSKVTIYHLLTHTSGIPNYTSFSDSAVVRTIPTTPEKLIARFRDKPLEFQPGDRWSYSNSGYVLLGYLIERISGQSYPDFVQENIFKPLGMNDSGYDANSAVILRRASGYSPSPIGVVNASYTDWSFGYSAGALYSTTHDLQIWEKGLFGGKVLTTASLKKMTTPFKENYACGLTVQTINGRREMEHSGGIDGFSSDLCYFPDEALTIVVLGNQDAPAPEIATKLASVVHGQNVVLPTERKEMTLSPAELEKYVGTYELAPAINIVITLEGGQLMGQVPGQPRYALFPESQTRFFLKAIDAQVDFTRSDSGKITQLLLHFNGRDIPGVRQ